MVVVGVAGVLVVGVLVVGALVTGVLVAGALVSGALPVAPVLPLWGDGDGDTEANPPEPPPGSSAPSPGTELLVVVGSGVVVVLVVVLVVGEALSSACWTNANLGAVGGCGARKANRASIPTATASDTNSVFLSQRLEATLLASPAALLLTTRSILIAASLPLGRAS
jgi:hypothetical protein